MPREGELVRVSAADPLNLVGILTPGPRLASQRNEWVLYRDGAVVDERERAALDPAGFRTARHPERTPPARSGPSRLH